MTPSDPGGLLQRMPELERIATDDAAVRAALASGDPFKLYRTLRWGSWTGRLKAHEALVKELLANRRLFARPLNGSPSLFTLNSFGVGFVGESEHHSDGTYITGHYLVILFKLPLLPLGAYVVGPGDTSTSYRIFARVPMGTFGWIWSRAAALATAILVASAAWGAFQDSRFAKVTIANGFKKPLQVELGGKNATIPPGSKTELTVPVGSQPARALVEGAVVDEGAIYVDSGNDAFIWNVGGVTALFKFHVDYYAVEPAWPSSPRLNYFCGQRVVVERNVDFLFREPDSSVSMSKGTKMVTKTMLSAQWAPAGDEGRSPCVVQLYLEGKADELRTTTDALRKAGELSTDEETLPIITALLAGTDEHVWDQAKALHERKRDDLEAERTVIWAAEETGHLDELVNDLNARRDASPDDADRAYLAVRAAPSTPTLQEAEALLLKFPAHDGLRKGVQFAANRESQWDRSLTIWTQRLDDAPAQACQDADLATRAAIPLHREAQVLEALDECGRPMSFQAVVAATRLAMASQQDPEPWLERLDTDAEKQRARLLAGLPVNDVAHTRLEPAARFLAAVHKSGDAVFAELPNLPMEELQTIDPEVALIVWSEAVRRNHSAAATFARRTHLSSVERKSLEAFLKGTAKDFEPKRYSPLVRAAVNLTRSRAEGLEPKEKERLQTLVRQDAVLTGFVLSALEHWP